MSNKYEMAQEREILFQNLNNAGVVTLNRPKSFNALTLNMVTQLYPKLLEWKKSRTCVIMKSARGKVFCAGGDVKEASTTKRDGPYIALTQYNISYLIKTLRIPYIVFINGIAMGGGLGLSVPGRYRVASENTVIAMPETEIGAIPDVGGTYFLPRLQNHLGFYLGLTGKRLKGKDVVASGIATHFVPSILLPVLENRLTLCSSDTEIKGCLDSISEPPGNFSLSGNLQDINHCFSCDTVEDIIKKLSEVNNEWSNETIEILNRMCPTMLKVGLRALLRGSRQDFVECLKMEYRVTWHNVGSYNFREGVRARLVDKDRRPRWRPAALAEVTEEEVESYFRRLPEDKELKFLDSKL